MPTAKILSFLIIIAITALIVFGAIRYAMVVNNQTLPDGSIVKTPPKKEKVVSGQPAGNPYLSKEYAIESSVSGTLKNIAADSQSMVILNEGKDYKALLHAQTEIFRNGKRAELADIQPADSITVMGRKKTQDSNEITADSVYAVTEQEVVVPLI